MDWGSKLIQWLVITMVHDAEIQSVSVRVRDEFFLPTLEKERVFDDEVFGRTFLMYLH